MIISAYCNIDCVPTIKQVGNLTHNVSKFCPKHKQPYIILIEKLFNQFIDIQIAIPASMTLELT